MKTTRLITIALVATVCACTGNEGVRYVDEFDLSGTVCGQGLQTVSCRNFNGDTLKIGETLYERGFCVRPEAAAVFSTNGKVAAFDAVVGIEHGSVPTETEYKDRPNAAIFRVWADGVIVWDSGMLKTSDGEKTVHVELSGVREIALETASGAPWISLMTTDAAWCDAKFTLEKGGRIKLLDNKNDYTQLGTLTPAEKSEPQFNGADIWGVRPGHPVIFRVPVSGVKPIKFTAENLPEGVTFDTEKGILGGIAPALKGDYDIKVTAENASGKAEKVITLAVGDTIALTPPMGWNSWNIWCYKLTDEKVRQSTLAMANSGLGDYGWSYINLDDWWEMNNSGAPRVAMREKDLGSEDVIGPARDASGRINTNRSFPDMKALTDFIHSYGFKAGLYSSPGTLTCGLCEGSYGHEMDDATSWAEWGFDYIKYDWCSYGKIFKKRMENKDAIEREEHIRPYALMNECLKKQDRDILYSYCQYGRGDVHEWARENGANCWRSWGDLKDGWTWMLMAIESHIDGEFYKYNGPGCWADPDMMIVGDQYSFGTQHPTLLTPNEQYTHVSLWSMISSPMLIGCDLTAIDDFTRSLLTNREVIAISQDRLGVSARRYVKTDAESVWARPLANGDMAIALVNTYPKARRISFDLSEVGFNDTYIQRDCWRQIDEGKVSGSISAEVPPHATKLIRLRCADCPKCD